MAIVGYRQPSAQIDLSPLVVQARRETQNDERITAVLARGAQAERHVSSAGVRANCTSGIVILIVAIAAACGTDDAASGSLDSVPPAATTPISALPTLVPETVTAMLESSPPDTGNPSATVASGSATDTAPLTRDLDGVPPESVPMVISEHLNRVQQAVRAKVGDDIFAGSAFTNDANDKMTVYGTDPAVIAAALDRVDTPLRDRISVAETRYSLNEIETYAEQARARLDAAGIAVSAGVQFGVDAVVVQLETPDGAPNDTIQTAATNVLGDIPVAISFGRPLVDL